MSKVRVLGGHAKRRVHSDGGRQAREVGCQWPAFRRVGALSPERIAGRSQSHLCFADQRMVRSDHPALRRWRQDLASARYASRRNGGPGRNAERREQQVRLRHFGDRQAADHASVLRRHAASVGVQAGVASGAFAHRSRHGLCGSGRCRSVPFHRWRAKLEGTFRPARPRHRPEVAAGRRRNVPAHDHS